MSATVPFVLGVAAILVGIYAGWVRWRLSRAETRANELAAARDKEMAAAAENDKLLRTIVETAPSALVVFGPTGTITFTNAAARDLFFDGAQVEGGNFLAMIQRAPEALRRAILSDGDELFTIDAEGSAETFHLSKRYFDNGATLVAVKQMTQEVERQELATLKKVIRVIGHEIGNSLAPISSLIRSARVIVKQPERWERLDSIFATVEERASHLGSFLEGYAKMARIPEPRREVVKWQPFVEGLRAFWPELVIDALPERPGFFDPAQIQQVLINLVKNATEAGGPAGATQLQVACPGDGGVRLTVLDGGAGMSDEVMQSALLPFFTTKPKGSGLGLALCREIIELHRGRLRLARRPTGGMAISFWLPDKAAGPSASMAQSRVRLSLA